MVPQDSITASAALPHGEMNGRSTLPNSKDTTSQEAGDDSPIHDPELADEGQSADLEEQSTLPIPVQKRRRVTRACDECRRKKIKCDGKQPCTHCTVYSYACTYDQPSNRRRNPAPQYIEALELRMQKAEALLRKVLPDVDLDDPSFDPNNVEEFISKKKKAQPKIKPEPETKEQSICPEPCDESLLESMVENTGALDLDDQGHWDYHGQSSGLMFVRHLRKQFGGLVPERPLPKFQQISQILESVKNPADSPIDTYMTLAHDLPPREIARQLCDNALEDACIVLRFMHKPTFNAMFDRIYDIPAEQYTNKENAYLPLLYLVLAVGCLFRGVGDCTLDKLGYEPAVDQGFQYFKAGRLLLDITECRDLTSLQAICFMIIFLQASANISTCYSYIGIALRASIRLGLHRLVYANFNPVEVEMRKRVFWVVRSMDIHVSTILGLPWMLSDDDIDQEPPLGIEDEYITPDGILPVPPGSPSLMAGVCAHIRLAQILLKVTKYIYPVKAANLGSGHTYMVSHSKIREIERDLQNWKEDLPECLRPGGESSPKVDRLRQLLRIGYAHVQMAMYRPFLHYVSAGSQGRIDKRSYACAAACVSVARNVVHITAEMKKKQLLNGSYWFTMYTTYFAILSLLFFILENPESATAKDGILKDALEGKNTLAGLAKRSMAADRCIHSLNAIFIHLPERLRNRRGNAPAPVNRKRTQAGTAQPAAMRNLAGTRTPPGLQKDGEGLPLNPVKRSNTFPIPITGNTFKKSYNTNTGPATGSPVEGSLSNTPQLSQSPSMLPPASPGIRSPSDKEPTTHLSTPSSPLSATQPAHSTPLKFPISFSPPFDTPAHLPDLMPMMFPSDDPFAYPNQPMSLLEDGHFKQESMDIPRQFSYRSGQHPMSAAAAAAAAAATLDSGTPSRTTASSPGGFLNTPTYPGFSSQDLNTLTGLTSRPKGPNMFSTHHERKVSESTPDSSGGSGAGYLENPDLVTMPGQAFLWQNLGGQGPGEHFFPQSVSEEVFPGCAADLTMPMDIAGMGGFNTFGMGMGMDLGMGLDTDLGGGVAATSGGGGGGGGSLEQHQYDGTAGLNNNSNNTGGSSSMNPDWARWSVFSNNLGAEGEA